MTNNIFKQFRQGQPAQQGQGQAQPDINQMFGQFQQDPMKALGKYNIPTDIQNDPNAILDHLVRSGQVTPQQLDAARQMQSRMFGKR